MISKNRQYIYLATLNDTPEIRKMFKKFHMEEVTLKYSMSRKEGSRAKQRTELLINNFLHFE